MPHVMRFGRLAASASLIFCALGADGDLQHASLGTFSLESGQVIRDLKLGYRTYGALNAARSNAILFPTWFTGTTANLAAYIGPGRMADSSLFHVIAVDALGNGVSSSPSNSTAQPRLQFPAFTIRDMVRSQHALLTRVLKIGHLRAVMGISMGGMQSFEWAVEYPEFMDRIVPIVGTPQLTSSDLLLWNGERRAILDHKDFLNGNYSKQPDLAALWALHDFAVSTPRHRSLKLTPRAVFAKYFDGLGRYSAFDANNWLRQLEAMISHDIAHGGTLETAARRVKAKALVVVATQDMMVSPLPALEVARLLKAQTVELGNDCGHLAGGCEPAPVNKAVAAFLVP
ncbi:MAG: alpha/beta fold hydrolase [Acidobacteria bacterium]|nr:alpha/beta fold hydrolase [Acidobacteriota bacterium]